MWSSLTAHIRAVLPFQPLFPTSWRFLFSPRGLLSRLPPSIQWGTFLSIKHRPPHLSQPRTPTPMGVQKAWPSHHLQALDEALLSSSGLRNVSEDSHLSPLTCGAGCRRADWMVLDHEGMGSEGGLPAQGTGLILLPSTLSRSLAGVRGEGLDGTVGVVFLRPHTDCKEHALTEGLLLDRACKTQRSRRGCGGALLCCVEFRELEGRSHVLASSRPACSSSFISRETVDSLPHTLLNPDS
ncbi:hypothetical protein GMRT_24444 [Giardia muris]|uniref:Uncharacterized protein n=1 Tax=Giardia muris TaxID=5742 RepID=A0A4Z1T0Y7_GIAMU|nr:hypothetical protein GMRT_24444 [Giardia muris]|eukprot:TNJ26189.1 hypothetical protein GMRT_24444 [Giardia muris]